MSIEIDGTERLHEVSDTLEAREVQVEWTRCGCGEHLKSIYTPGIQAEWVNVALHEECEQEVYERARERHADYAIDDARLVG